MALPFYRDPLEAAWMAKYLGMEFFDGIPHTAKLSWKDFSAVPCNAQHEVRLTIHPNSLHLLEPKVGDVVYTNLNGWISVEQLQSEERAAEARFFIRRGGRIIQRDNKPFFWPEVEP